MEGEALSLCSSPVSTWQSGYWKTSAPAHQNALLTGSIMTVIMNPATYAGPLKQSKTTISADINHGNMETVLLIYATHAQTIATKQSELS